MNVLKKLKISIEYLFFFILEKILLLHESSVSKSILFINTGQIGDLVVSSIILENPDVFVEYEKVKFIVKEQYLELFSDYDGKIEFISYNPIKYKLFIPYKVKFLNYIRSYRFEKCINLTAARGIINEELTLLSGAKEKYCLNNNIKFLGQFIGKKLERRYTDILFAEITNEYNKHISLLKKLSGNYNLKVNFYNRLTFNTNNVNALKNYKSVKNLISIAPFSFNKNKDWPKGNLQKLIGLLNNDHQIILFGSKQQEKDLLGIKGNHQNVTILTNELKTNEIPSLLTKSKIFIGLDSGLTHLALKLGIPLVAIIGGGFYQRFFPFMESAKVKYLYYKMDCFGCEWNCIYDKKHCIEDISEDEVFREIEKILHPEKA